MCTLPIQCTHVCLYYITIQYIHVRIIIWSENVSRFHSDTSKNFSSSFAFPETLYIKTPSGIQTLFIMFGTNDTTKRCGRTLDRFSNLCFLEAKQISKCTLTPVYENFDAVLIRVSGFPEFFNCREHGTEREESFPESRDV